MDKLHELGARELIGMLRDGELSVERLTAAYLERIRRFDGRLNAVAELDPSSLSQARALDADAARRALPLFGLPILVKDNIDVAGLHTTAGSLALSRNVAEHDAPIVARLRASGAVILGKTNMTEFANYTAQDMPNGYSSRGGQVYGAYLREKDPGGSSTGSAVAVSAGFCAAAIGTDTLFSVVGCATEHGVAGYKPPHGALSADGIVPICRTMDSAGVLARRAADAALIYACMREAPLSPVVEAPPEMLRIAVNVMGREDVSRQQLARYDALFRALRNAGAQISEVAHENSRESRHIMRCEFRRDLEGYLAGTGDSVPKTLAAIVAAYRRDSERMAKYGISMLEDALNSGPEDAEYIEALKVRADMHTRLMDSLAGFDACVMTGDTDAFHMCGLPSIALGLGMGPEGAPRGVVLYGAYETRLLSAALTIEKFCEPVRPPVL